MAVQKNVGFLLLAVYLILVGVGGLVAFVMPSPVMAVLALLAGVMIIVGR